MDEPNELGTIAGHGSVRRVEVRRVVNAPIEKVWSALTDPAELRQWWECDVLDAREGGRIKLGVGVDGDDCEGTGPDQDGTIKVFMPPHIFEFTWNDDYDDPGLVRFDLVEFANNTTQVTLVQTLSSTDLLAAAAGWHEIVERLGVCLDSGELVPVPANAARYRELYAVYEASRSTV